MGEKDKV